MLFGSIFTKKLDSTINQKNKKMRLFLLLITCCFLSISASFAQETSGELDLVILKNGTRIYGEITENKPGDMLKMITEQGSEMNIKYSEIKGVVYDTSLEESEPIPPSRKGRGREEPRESREDRPLDKPAERGYFSTGGGLNIAEYSDFGALTPLPTIYVAGGYRMGSHFILAGGLQLITADVDLYLSVFAEAKVNFLKSSATPYFSLRSGILFPVIPFPATRTTYNINPSFGVRLPSKNKVHSSVYVGYMYLPYSGANDFGWNWPGIGEYHVLSIGGGIEF